MRKASFSDQAMGSRFSFRCLGRLSSADALFSVFRASSGVFASLTLRATLRALLRYAAFLQYAWGMGAKAGRAGRPCPVRGQPLFFQSRLYRSWRRSRRLVTEPSRCSSFSFSRSTSANINISVLGTDSLMMASWGK